MVESIKELDLSKWNTPCEAYDSDPQRQRPGHLWLMNADGTVLHEWGDLSYQLWGGYQYKLTVLIASLLGGCALGVYSCMDGSTGHYLSIDTVTTPDYSTELYRLFLVSDDNPQILRTEYTHYDPRTVSVA